MITPIVISHHDTLHSLQNSFRDGQLPFRLAAIKDVIVNHANSNGLENRQSGRQQAHSRLGGFGKFRENCKISSLQLSVQLPEK